jgi:hypothetical protein
MSANRARYFAQEMNWGNATIATKRDRRRRSDAYHLYRRRCVEANIRRNRALCPLFVSTCPPAQFHSNGGDIGRHFRQEAFA